MKDDDSFLGLFKESSESTRDFDFKQSGWDKLNNRLNDERAKKRRKFLLILPWILLPGLLIFNAMLFRNQNEANENILRLQQELTNRGQTKVDTIVKEKHIYTHDTVYVYVTHYPITNNSAGRSVREKFITKAIADQSVIVKLSIDTNTSQTNSNNKPEKENLPVKESIDTINSVAISDKEINDNRLDKLNGLIEKKGTDTAFVKTNIQTINDNGNVINQNDTLVQTSNSKSDTISKEKITLKHRLNKIKFEYGVQGGGVYPQDQFGVDQFGFNAGAGVNALLTKHVHAFTNLSYGQLTVRTRQMNQEAWIGPVPSPDSSYSLDNASTHISSLHFTVGPRYFLPLATHFNLVFDLGYGAHYIFPSKVIYEFKNDNLNQDLVVETKPKHTGFVPNDLHFGLGLGYNINDRYNVYLLSHYRINRQSTPYKLPE